MRIDRLDLIAFGPFTELSLDLSAPGIHMIVGPNEAGKSTALHALGQLLYGMDLRSAYGFVHPTSALRLGGLLYHPGGEKLEIVRTRSRNTPLVRPDGRPIEEVQLAPYLSGIDQQTFLAEFALTAAELRRGGQLLVDGKGDSGQALAASRSGLRLIEALRGIESRLAELYKKSGQRPQINTRITTLREARERARSAALRPNEFLTKERAVSSARERQAQLAEQLRITRAEYSQLDRLRQTLPAAARRRALLDDLAALLKEGALAPPNVTQRLQPLRQEIHEAKKLLDQQTSQLKSISEALVGLPVDERLLVHADAIERLSQEVKAVQEAQRVLATSSGKAKRLRSEAQALLEEVHAGSDLGKASLFQIPEAVRVRAQKLHDRHTVLTTSLQQAEKTLSARQRKWENAEKRLAELPPVEETGTMRAAVAAIPDDLLNRMVTANEGISKARVRAEQILQELKLRTITVDNGEAIFVPARAQVSAHLDAERELAQGQRDAAKEHKAATGRLEKQRLRLAQLLQNDPPPTEQDLTSARQHRDGLWRQIRGQRDLPSEDYERAVLHADQIADQIRRDAQRISERLRLELDITQEESALVRIGQEQMDLAQQGEDLDAAWIRLWETYPADPPSSAAAAETIEAIGRLREALATLRDGKSRLEILRTQAIQHIGRLRELLRQAEDGQVVLSIGAETALAELPELREIAENRLAEYDEAIRTRTTREAQVAKEAGELSEAEATVTEHREDLAAWQDEWRKLLGQAGLLSDRDTVTALADLDRLNQVAGKMTEATETDNESEQAAHRVEHFNTLLRTTVQACGRDLPADDSDRHLIVAALAADLRANRSNADTRDRLVLDQRAGIAAAGEYRSELEHGQEELADLVKQSGVTGDDELEEAVSRRTRHDTLQNTLVEVTATITTHGEALHELMNRAASTDPDQLNTELSTLGDRIGVLEDRQSEESTHLGQQENELSRLDGSAVAAEAEADTAVITAALIEETEEYLRLEIAKNVLLTCIEEYRQTQADPVLTRAGHLFEKLTLGGFRGLEHDETGDSPTILARRNTGDLLAIDQLSEGTADQLYLALRLASLERYAEENRALPFTVDDIFMTFDDQRASAALKVLDDMTDRFQTIVWTHHEHLADLAHAVIPAGRIHLHKLPRFIPGTRSPLQSVPAPKSASRPAQRDGDRTCRDCGTTLAYVGRGRPPVRCANCSN